MNRMEHARAELMMLGKDKKTVQLYLDAVAAISDVLDVGDNFIEIMNNLTKVVYYQNISPLTDSPDEWMNVGAMIGKELSMWQSARNPEAFSTDGGKTYYLLSERDMGINDVHPTVAIGDPNA